MLTFKPVNVKSSARLRKYYKNCPYRLCEYSVGVKLMWRHHMDPSFAESNGCLIVRNAYHGSQWTHILEYAATRMLSFLVFPTREI